MVDCVSRRLGDDDDDDDAIFINAPLAGEIFQTLQKVTHDRDDDCRIRTVSD